MRGQEAIQNKQSDTKHLDPFLLWVFVLEVIFLKNSAPFLSSHLATQSSMKLGQHRDRSCGLGEGPFGATSIPQLGSWREALDTPYIFPKPRFPRYKQKLTGADGQ